MAASLQRIIRPLFAMPKTPDDPPIPHVHSFRTPYVQSIIKKLAALAPKNVFTQTQRVSDAEVLVYITTLGGADTAGHFAAYAVASQDIHNAHLTPSQATLALARLRNGIDNIDHVRELLGVGDLHKPDTINQVLTTDGFNMDILRSKGFGQTIGCPARMQATDETWQYLEQNHGVTRSNRLVIDEFTRKANDYFRKEVLPHIHTHASKLQPAFLEEMKALKTTSCPYHKA